METFITTVAIGLFIAVLGIINMTGNISSLHWYHRQRVKEEDRKAFGLLVGLGTLIIGVSVAAFGGFFLIADKSGSEVFAVVGTALLIVGFSAGLVLSFYAMIKYNKGIF